jgi:hypothetical protein
VNELKEVFKKNSLAKLTRLKFTFGEEDMVPNISDLDIDDEPIPAPAPPEAKKSVVVEEPEEEDIDEPVNNTPIAPVTYLDENKKPIELTDEDREILAEEARAERNRKAIEAKKKSTELKPIAKKVELPPKRKIEMAIAERDYESDCECGPDEACEKCIDKKSL